MIGLPAGRRIWLAVAITDMSSGMNGLAGKTEAALAEINTAATYSCSAVGAATFSRYCDGRRWHVFAGKAPRAELLRLTTRKQRQRLSDVGAAVDAVPRNGLAATRTHLATNVCHANVRCLA